MFVKVSGQACVCTNLTGHEPGLVPTAPAVARKSQGAWLETFQTVAASRRNRRGRSLPKMGSAPPRASLHPELLDALRRESTRTEGVAHDYQPDSPAPRPQVCDESRPSRLSPRQVLSPGMRRHGNALANLG